MEINVHNQQQKINWLPTWEDIIYNVCGELAVLQGLTADAEAEIVLVDNTAIRALNAEYRGKDNVTDVISFALNDTDGELPPHPASEWLLGDIYISLERCAEQAAEYGHAFERELAYLTVHGLLHLLGYDHDTEQNKAEMRQIEEGVLSTLTLSRQ